MVYRTSFSVPGKDFLMDEKRVGELAIPQDYFRTLWFEDEHGDRWFPPLNPLDRPGVRRPETHRFQHARFVYEVHERVFDLRSRSPEIPIMRGTCGYSDDLATALVVSGRWTVCEAVALAAFACERCGNYLRFLHGLDGYDIWSPEWDAANTSCELCSDAPAKPHA